VGLRVDGHVLGIGNLLDAYKYIHKVLLAFS